MESKSALSKLVVNIYSAGKAKPELKSHINRYLVCTVTGKAAETDTQYRVVTLSSAWDDKTMW